MSNPSTNGLTRNRNKKNKEGDKNLSGSTMNNPNVPGQSEESNTLQIEKIIEEKVEETENHNDEQNLTNPRAQEGNIDTEILPVIEVEL